MNANQTGRSKVEQRSVIKFLEAEKCKLCEIYMKISMCTERHVLVKKKYYKLIKHKLATISQSQKVSPWSETKLTLNSRKGFWRSGQ